MCVCVSSDSEVRPCNMISYAFGKLLPEAHGQVVLEDGHEILT